MRFQLALVLAASLLGGCLDLGGDDCSGGGGDDDGESSGGGSGSGVGDCPGGPTCAPETPDGLTFSGAQVVASSFPASADTGHNHIAAGGTDVIQLQDDGAPFDLVYTAAVDDPLVLSIESVVGATVALRGHGGTTELDIDDPASGLLFDRYAYASSGLATAIAVPAPPAVDFYDRTAAGFAFWPGDLSIGIALLDRETPAHRLVDTSLALTLAGATQTHWDQISMPDATVGHYAVTVTSGGLIASAEVDVVDHADVIVPLFTNSGFACFAALLGGNFINGVPWTYTIGGETVPSDEAVFGPNCVFDPSGATTFTVTASAGGQSITADVTPQ